MSRGIELLTLRVLRLRHLVISRSSTAILTSPSKHEKFRVTKEVKDSGKRLSQLIEQSSISFSCRSSSLRFLQKEYKS